MPGSGRTYYVAGAGIAGLTLALALAKFGATVVVLERNATISEFGAGLQISPNARKILNDLGLDEALAACSLEPTGIDIYPWRRPAPLVTLELGIIMRARFGAAYAVMHRADLADALYKACRRFANIDMLFGVRSVDAVNDAQKKTLFSKVHGYFNGKLEGKTIGVWGLSFKPKTDDIREAPALVFINQILEAGGTVRVNDPVAEENVRAMYEDRIVYCPDRYEAAEGADALAILTEWNEFRTPDLDYLKRKLKNPVVFDGRNLYDPQSMAKAGFQYYGVGLRSNSEGIG